MHLNVPSVSFHEHPGGTDITAQDAADIAFVIFQTPLIIYDLLVLLAPRMVAGCLHKLTRTPKGML